MFRFRPGFIPTLATVLVFPLLLALGFWQLDRAQQKEHAQAAFEARLEQPTLNLNQSAPDPEADTFRLAEAQGTYDADQQLLLDNQTHNREVGYNVLSPFLLEGSEMAVLVDRGWVPAGSDRQRLPALPVPQAIDRVHGHLDQGPATGIRLGGMADGEHGWPLRVQFLDYQELGERLGYPLMPVVLRLDEAATGGFVRQWRPRAPAGFGPERNRGYAVQWFGLAATLLIIFLVVNLKRRAEDNHADP